ncbi:MAG: hypothetical protein IPO98_05200 [Saprospiraceae bacterium]|nr:hypothetical protein [Saprospiraceae bacterium]
MVVILRQKSVASPGTYTVTVTSSNGCILDFIYNGSTEYHDTNGQYNQWSTTDLAAKTSVTLNATGRRHLFMEYWWHYSIKLQLHLQGHTR